jgi:hypothetical protein
MSETSGIDKILEHLHVEGGRLTVAYDDEEDDWTVAFEFGHEAEDSPMVGGASYATGRNLEVCLNFIADEVGI